MARLPRLIVPHQPHFIIQNGSDAHLLFREAADYRRFLAWLHDSAKFFKVQIHAYVLLPGQFQLLATPPDGDALARCLQRTGRHYVPWYNAKYGRTGALFGGRHKTSVVEAGPYLLSCSLYIEAAAQRAGQAGEGEMYPWSSFAHHVGMQSDPIITEHRLVWDLGNTPFHREAAWKALAERGLGAMQQQVIEAAVCKGWPLGSDSYKAQLQDRTQRQVLPARRGRPPKVAKAPIDSGPN